MTTNDWISVAASIGGGLLVGVVLSRVVAIALGRPSRPQPIQDSARPLASLAFSVGLVSGLLVALGIVQPDAVAQLRNDAVAFVPKILTAVIIVILANVLSSFAVAALGQVLARATPAVQRQAAGLARGLILVMALLLAVGTLGIDTTVVNLGVAAAFFAVAASFTLLVGLGGRTVASEVASSRAVRRLVKVGDVITVGQPADQISGAIIALHPTAVELQVGDDVVLVPSSRIVSETLGVERVADETAS
jgi:flagellar biosynthesis protein FliQ